MSFLMQAAAVALLFIALQLQAVEPAETIAARVDAVVPELMERHATPGVAIAYVDDGRIAWRRCYGVMRAGDDAPVSAETVFEACSMSKPLFAYAALKLAEQGQLDVDRPLVDYLGESHRIDDPRQARITGRMALTHTTGLPNWRPGGWRAGGPIALMFEPGERFSYSGEGIWFLQQALERIVDEPMEPWIQRTLLGPLEMTRSSYVWQEDYEHWAAAGHDAKGQPKRDRPHYDRENAGFSLYTTADDYARFLIEVSRADRTAPHSLGRAALDEMLAPAVETDKPGIWRGLGWAIDRQAEGHVVSHSGANGTGFRCHAQFDPQTRRGIVIMTNAIGGAQVWTGALQAIEADAAERQ